MKIYYRKEIDGLRALAVIPVVFYHAYHPGIGVDVFCNKLTYYDFKKK